MAKTKPRFTQKTLKNYEPYLHRGNIYLVFLNELNWIVARANKKGELTDNTYRYYHHLEHAINRFLAECARDIYIPEKPQPIRERMDIIRQEMADQIHVMLKTPLGHYLKTSGEDE